MLIDGSHGRWLPCVVSNIRGNADLIDHGLGGYLTAPNDVNGISKAISSLVDDVHLRGKMGQWNLQKIQAYSVGFVKRQMKEIYETVI